MKSPNTTDGCWIRYFARLYSSVRLAISSVVMPFCISFSTQSDPDSAPKKIMAQPASIVAVLSGMVVPLPFFPDGLQPWLFVQPFAGLVVDFDDVREEILPSLHGTLPLSLKEMSVSPLSYAARFEMSDIFEDRRFMYARTTVSTSPSDSILAALRVV